MLNKIIVMGRLTHDPELRRTGSGTPVCSFSIACDRDFKSQSGEKETDFFDVVAWRATGEFVSKYFAKGRMVVVEGRLQIREWQDKEGNKRRSAEVVADNVYFGESKRSREESGSAPRTSDSYRSNDNYRASSSDNYRSYDAAPAASAFSELSDTDGELPF